ncbi:hypothetical protein VPH35_123793 [Triticum aestivum]
MSRMLKNNSSLFSLVVVLRKESTFCDWGNYKIFHLKLVTNETNGKTFCFNYSFLISYDSHSNFSQAFGLCVPIGLLGLVLKLCCSTMGPNACSSTVLWHFPQLDQHKILLAWVTLLINTSLGS